MVLNTMYMGLYPLVAHSGSSGSEFPDKVLILSLQKGLLYVPRRLEEGHWLKSYPFLSLVW